MVDLLFWLDGLRVAPWPMLGSRLLDQQTSVEPHRPRDVEVVGRGLHARLVDLPELLRRTVALDPHDVADHLVARRYGGIDAEEAAQVQRPRRLDLELVEGDAPGGGAGHVA